MRLKMFLGMGEGGGEGVWQIKIISLILRKPNIMWDQIAFTKSPRKNVPDVGIELGAACMPIRLPLPLIQEEQLSVTIERRCTKYW